MILIAVEDAKAYEEGQRKLESRHRRDKPVRDVQIEMQQKYFDAIVLYADEDASYASEIIDRMDACGLKVWMTNV